MVLSPSLVLVAAKVSWVVRGVNLPSPVLSAPFFGLFYYDKRIGLNSVLEPESVPLATRPEHHPSKLDYPT